MTYSFSDWQSGALPPHSWDVANAVEDGWTKADIDVFMRATVKPWSPPRSPERVAETPARSEPVAAPIPVAAPVAQLKTTQQEKPATVTHIHTRKTVEASKAYEMEFVCGEDGSVKPGITKNWSMLLENHDETRGVFAYDRFKLRVMLMRCPPWNEAGASWEPRALQDRDYSEAVMWLEGKYMTPKPNSIAPVIHTIAERAAFDRLREYLDALEWDGKPRVATWINDYLGVEDTPYARTVGLRWLISSVARGLVPGCKVDTMPILEGPQGARKSTAIRVLYGDEFFTDELSDIGSKDAMMEMQGVWGLEVAEMHRFSAAETNAVKKFLTRQTDRFRPPYGRSVIEAPRRVILNGTINPEGNGYLRDVTGARRFWPLTIGKISLDKLARDRDQLWAEARSLFLAGAPWWVQDEELIAVEAEQEKRTDVDVWTSIIATMLKTRNSITQWDIFEALSIPRKDTDYRHAGRVGRIMKKFGWEAHRDRSNGEDRIVYRDPNVSWADEPKLDDW